MLLEDLTAIDVEAYILSLMRLVIMCTLVEKVIAIAIEHHYVPLPTARPICHRLIPVLHGRLVKLFTAFEGFPILMLQGLVEHLQWLIIMAIRGGEGPLHEHIFLLMLIH